MSAPERRHRLSASKRKLGRSCLYWARDDVALPEDPSAGAAVGSALHQSADEDVSEDALRDGWRPGADLDAIAERWGLSPLEREKLFLLHDVWAEWWSSFASAEGWRTEVPFAFDVATGRARALPCRGPRDYSACSSTEVPGTIDALRIDPAEGVAVVLDLKTGRPPKRASDYIDQLAFGALCATRVHGLERARVVLAHVPERGVFVDEAELDAFDLDAAAADLPRVLGAISTAEPNPGLHCRELFCPARACCPATTAALTMVASSTLSPAAARRLPLVGPIEDDDQAITLLEGLPRLEAWIDDRKRALRAYADETEGLRLPDGRVWAGRPAKSTTLHLEVRGAEGALRSVLGDAAELAISRGVTQVGIDRAARRLAVKHGDIKRIRQAALEALRAAGAVKKSEFRRYEARAAGPEEATNEATTE